MLSTTTAELSALTIACSFAVRGHRRLQPPPRQMAPRFDADPVQPMALAPTCIMISAVKAPWIPI